MAFRQRREKLRSILNGSACIRPGSVYDATSIRIAEDLGFELGMFGGSVASLVVLGDPDIALITLTELAEQMRRMSRAADLPVLVDADHGYGNALNVRRTVQELEAAGAAGLTIEDTLLPQAFGAAQAPADLARGRRRQDEGRARWARRSGAGDHGPYRYEGRRPSAASRTRSCARRPMRPPASMRCFSRASRPRRGGGDFGRDHTADRARRRARGTWTCRLSSSASGCGSRCRATRRSPPPRRPSMTR